ncbi:MAG: hypothetical protein ACTSPI_00925 [Candidatus Heimdallarchaeaceae archaeon]
MKDIRSLFNEFIRAGIMDSFGDEIISKFFKSKKPVEVIAEGKVEVTERYPSKIIRKDGVLLVEFNDYYTDVLKKKNGKNVRIIVEEMKED